MIYTVTLNPAMDKTAVIENFAPGEVNRVVSFRLDAGGKGINVSKCLHSLGADTVAAVTLAGQTGRQLESMVKNLGIPVLAVYAPGESRTNLKIVDPVKMENTDINEPGPAVSREILDALRLALGEKLREGDSVVLSGSLPRGADAELYRDWTRYFQSLGASVFLDCDGQALGLGLEAKPYLIKPNEKELARLLGKENLEEGEMLSAGKALLERGVREAVISLGRDGALFFSRQGAFRAEGLDVPVQSTVGAGDAMVAAMAYGKEKGLGGEDTVRLAMAISAASVMQTGTQPPEKELVRALATKVKLTKLSF